MRTQLIVGVSGGSGAGKHLVIHDHLLPSLGADAQIIEHDWYYYDFEHLYHSQNVSSRSDINYDQPGAYENSLLVHHLEELCAGRSVDIHRYQKGIGLRSTEPLHLEPSPIIVLDGMMLFAVDELVKTVQIGAYVHASDRVRLQRRIKRDLAFSTVDESVLRFQRDVLPAHRQYVEPSAVHSRFIVNNSWDGKPPLGVDEFIECVLKGLHGIR